MITIYIKSASMTGIMMPYLLHRLQFTNVQKGKTILLPLSCQPRKTFCLGTQHTAAAVSSPVVGDLFTGPGEKVKMADPPFGQSIQPVCHVTLPHQLHVRQKSVPLHRHSGVEIGRTAAPGIAQPVEHPRPCSESANSPAIRRCICWQSPKARWTPRWARGISILVRYMWHLPFYNTSVDGALGKTSLSTHQRIGPCHP